VEKKFSARGARSLGDEPENVRCDWRIPDALWERLQPWLPPRKPHPLGCHRPRVDDRRALEAICFVLRTGCPWHARPATGLCASRSAHRRFPEWAAAGGFVAFGAPGLAVYEAWQGIDGAWLAMDGALPTAPRGGKVGKHPTDRGPIGTKRSRLTAGGGIPLGLTVEGATRNDGKMVHATLTSLPVERPMPTHETPHGQCVDQGDDFDDVRARLATCACTAHIRARGEEAHAITHEAGDKARRWVVEPPQSGMNRFRRLLVRWDKKGDNYLAFLQLAGASITDRRSGLLG
jgi:putative transposase